MATGLQATPHNLDFSIPNTLICTRTHRPIIRFQTLLLAMFCFFSLLFSPADCSTGTVKDAMIFRHAVLGDTGKDLVLGHVDAPRSGHIFVVLCVPQRWGIGSYTRTTRTSIMEEYHGYE